MHISWMALMLGLMMMVAVGVAVVAALVKLLGGRGAPAGEVESEARLMQELHKGFARLEERVEALEAILIEQLDTDAAERGA